MEKGDIILIPFPFTDLSGNKKRPALVLVSGDMDISVAFIFTQIKWKEDTDVFLKPTKENGLKKDSLVRLSKLATIDKDLAIGLIGRVDEDTIKSINQNLIKFLNSRDKCTYRQHRIYSKAGDAETYGFEFQEMFVPGIGP